MRKFKDNIFLITGASGFVGSNLLRRLVEEKAEVYIILRKNSKTWRIKNILDKVNIHTGDLSKFNEVQQIVDKTRPTVIYHLASYGAYPYQKNVEKILKKHGYATELNQIVKGKYIRHEIDISARKNKEMIMVECKHHNRPWAGCSIQTALYVYARFLDIKGLFTSAMLVTNTKFSSQVADYAKGVGLKLMGWRFPEGNSLEYNIERFKLYPKTMLTSLDKTKVNSLLQLGIFLVSDLSAKDVTEISKMLKISKSKAGIISEEAQALSMERDLVGE